MPLAPAITPRPRLSARVSQMMSQRSRRTSYGKIFRKSRADALGLESLDLAPAPARYELWKADQTKFDWNMTSSSAALISQRISTHDTVIHEDDDKAEAEDDPLSKLMTRLPRYMDTIVVDQGRSSMYEFVEPQTIQPSANKNRKTKLEFKHYSKEDELNRNPPFSLCVAHFLYCPASVPFQPMVSSILCWTFSSTGFSTYQAPYTTLLYWKKLKLLASTVLEF
ncbi:hypothetical protein LR48_Vigan11g096700 [Vigna angularis]|uniref:Uncharacterized protein n=1 Tax=Phaseolus angularis TaxID=3914 RepID=A0A0L9VT50_PHAAN|nr:hypothetical protein LR48_Vigan11g096700 [Vigna angularis]